MWKFNGLGIVIPFLSSQQKIENLLENIQKAQDLAWISEVILVIDWRENAQSIQNLKTVQDSNFKKLQILIDVWGSAGSARNAGLKACDSAWLHFCDSDDLILYEGLLRLLQETEHQDAAIGIGGYLEESTATQMQKNRPLNSKNKNSSLCRVVKAPGIWRFIFDHDLIDGIQFPHSSMGEDQVFISRCFSKVEAIHISSEVVYKYLQDNSESLTNGLIDLNELRTSASLTLQSINLSSEYRWFQELLYVNQTLSVIKRVHFKVRIRLLFHLILRIIRLGTERALYPNLARILFLR
jgi:glycosyltransferase involved in cell wall biosynthesis